MDPPSSGSHHTRTWSLEMGDYIGMESCIDLEDDAAVETGRRRSCCGGGGYRRRGWRMSMEKREFPPPIPLLAQTENLPSHMPWVLKRHYSEDGRLIIWEEKVRHHEYIRAQRSNGRLTLQLVPLDNQVLSDDDDPDDDEDDKEEEEEECNDDVQDEVKVEEEEEKKVEEMAAAVAVSGGGGGGGKCYNNYSGVRSNPCMYGMEVPAIRPVHI